MQHRRRQINHYQGTQYDRSLPTSLVGSHDSYSWTLFHWSVSKILINIDHLPPANPTSMNTSLGLPVFLCLLQRDFPWLKLSYSLFVGGCFVMIILQVVCLFKAGAINNIEDAGVKTKAPSRALASFTVICVIPATHMLSVFY